MEVSESRDFELVNSETGRPVVFHYDRPAEQTSHRNGSTARRPRPVPVPRALRPVPAPRGIPRPVTAPRPTILKPYQLKENRRSRGSVIMGENAPVVVPTKVTQNKVKRLNKKEKNLKRQFSRISDKNKNIRKELERDVTKTQTELNKITGKATDEPKTLLDADIPQEEILQQPLQPTKYQEIKKLLYMGEEKGG